MAANLDNYKFKFGFLNQAQDPDDLADNEAVSIDSLDPDKLALGTLQVSALMPTSTTKVTTPATLGGRSFRVTSGDIEQLEDSVTPDLASYRVVNKGSTTTTGYPPKGNAPSGLAVTDGVVVSTPTGSITSLVANLIAGGSYTGSEDNRTVRIKVDTDVTKFAASLDAGGSYGALVVIAAGTAQAVLGPGGTDEGIRVTFDAGYVPVAGHTSNFTVTRAANAGDGTYAYVLVNVRTGSIVKPSENIQGIPGDVVTLDITNFNSAGDRVRNFIPRFTFPAEHANATEQWLYRKSPIDTDFVRIAKYDGTNVTADRTPSSSSVVAYYDDLGLTSDIINVIILESIKDESFQTIDAAIGNTSNDYDRIFEKDGRLWTVPTTRKDLILYSRLGAWWGWSRAQSFGFKGNYADHVILRDPRSNTGATVTVIGTTNGIYHIDGNGTEAAPYNLQEAIPEISVMPGSMLNINGTIMFMSKSSTGVYGVGAYGQKIYEYDLLKLTEVSARIIGNAIITGMDSLMVAGQRGSDKYQIQKSGGTSALVYHRDARGWVEIIQASETATTWSWTSKNYQPTMFKRFKIGYARFFKIEYKGTVTVAFTMLSGNALTSNTSTFTLTNSATRVQVIQRLPGGLGRKWKMVVTGGAAAVVYDFFLVS